MSTAKRLNELLQRIRKLITPRASRPMMPASMALLLLVALVLIGCASAPVASPERVFCVAYSPVCFGANDTVSLEPEVTTIKNNERWFAACNGGKSICRPDL